MEFVAHVEARENFRLELKFSNGETRLLGARLYLDKGVFQRLKDPTLFRCRSRSLISPS